MSDALAMTFNYTIKNTISNWCQPTASSVNQVISVPVFLLQIPLLWSIYNIKYRTFQLKLMFQFSTGQSMNNCLTMHSTQSPHITAPHTPPYQLKSSSSIKGRGVYIAFCSIYIKDAKSVQSPPVCHWGCIEFSHCCYPKNWNILFSQKKSIRFFAQRRP